MDLPCRSSASDNGKGTGGSLFCTARACDVIARLYFCIYTSGHRRTWRDAYLPCNGHAFVNTPTRRARSGQFINQIEAVWTVQFIISITFRINKIEVGVKIYSNKMWLLQFESFSLHSPFLHFYKNIFHIL